MSDWYDGAEDIQPYSYTRNGVWNNPTFGNRALQPMVPMIMIPTFGREVWWTVEEAFAHFPDDTIQHTGKPFL